MPIAQTKYINIISTAGAVPTVSQRELIGRVFSSHYLIPTNTVIEFDGGASKGLSEIGNYVGVNSAEYGFASKYFAFESKKGLKPKKIGFARYLTEAVPAYVVGKSGVSLTDLKSITNGSLILNLNGENNEFSGINLSSANSLTNVASLISSAITNNLVVCEYDEDNGRFLLKTVATGDGQTLSVKVSDLALALGFESAIVSDGSEQKTAVECVSGMEEISNNFFTFTFLDSLGSGDVVALAQWVNSQNVRYMFSYTVNPTNAETIQALVKDYDGVALTLDIYNQHAGFMPMAAIAAIDYTRPNAGIDMMYQQFDGVEPSVADNADADKYDGLKVNYYGATQQAGRQVAFYQNGILQGSISSMGVFANEAWLKDNFFTNLLNLRLGLDSLPASQTGKSLVMNVMADTIELAKYNGVIQFGKTLSQLQKATITEITGNTDAWMSVQSAGYWLSADVVEYQEDGAQKYKITYLLVYGKGDSINFIDGRDILI